MATADLAVRVDPKDIRFTAASILVSFEASPLQDKHIDKTVDLLLSENWPSRNCPILPVIRYENALWSLQNQWLWVYRRAKFPRVDALVLDPASESPDAFLATANTPDVACFLALLKKPLQMARMKSEIFFPTVQGDWKVHHSDELIDAIRLRHGSNSHDESMRAPDAVPKFGAPGEPSPVPPWPASPVVKTQTGSEGDENVTIVVEELASPRRGESPSEQCRVMGLGIIALSEVDASKRIAMANLPDASPSELKFSPADDDRYSEAILAAMSAAAVHGVTFTVPVNPPAASIAASSVSDGDPPLATLTGFFVP